MAGTGYVRKRVVSSPNQVRSRAGPILDGRTTRPRSSQAEIEPVRHSGEFLGGRVHGSRQAGAPCVVLRATHEGALDYCVLADLKRFAVDLA